MTKKDAEFETWFDILAVNVLDRTGVNFRDKDSVRDDYEAGMDLYDIADSIAAEYGENDDT